MTNQQSEFEFDRHRSIISKIGRTFLLLIVGAFFGIFHSLIFYAQNDHWWIVVFKIVIEICWSFWILAILYVWFEWEWLRNLYLHAERRFLRLATFLKWVLPLIAAGVIGFVWYLSHIGVLPVPPK